MLSIAPSDWQSMIGAVGDGPIVGDDPPTPVSVSAFNFPNLVTLAGFAAGLAWIAGASPIWALVSLVCDELDGPIARETGQASPLGARLDWATDICLGAAIAVKVGGWYVAPLALFVQSYLKENEGWAPPLGSARAVGMVYLLGRGGV